MKDIQTLIECLEDVGFKEKQLNSLQRAKNVTQSLKYVYDEKIGIEVDIRANWVELVAYYSGPGLLYSVVSVELENIWTIQTDDVFLICYDNEDSKNRVSGQLSIPLKTEKERKAIGFIYDPEKEEGQVFFNK